MTATEDKYRLMMQKLLPRGAAWSREEAAELTLLLQGLAAEHARVEGRGLDLLEELDPRTTTELIDDWERVLGLPGNCSSPSTLADRRLAAWQKLLGHGDPNLSFWQEQIEALGFTFGSIEEYRPYDCTSNTGDHVIGTKWITAWAVVVESRTEAFNTLLQCTLDDLAPIHTTPEVVVIPYGGWAAQTPDASYTGAFRAVSKNVSIGGIKFVAVGTGGEIQTTTDGKTWTHRAPAGAFAGIFYGVTNFSIGKICIVGAAGEIQRSTNHGVAWAADTAAGGYVGTFWSVAYNGSVVCAVGSAGEIQTTPVGTPGTWTAQTADAGFSSTFRCIAADQASDILVIAGASGEIQWSTDDGAAWNHADPGENYAGTWIGATYANGHFWLVGTSGEIQQSVDGKVWRRITNDKTGQWDNIYGDGVDGILVVGGGASKDLRSRTRIGPEMLFTTLVMPAGSNGPYDIVVYSNVAVAVGPTGMIWKADRYGS